MFFVFAERVCMQTFAIKYKLECLGFSLNLNFYSMVGQDTGQRITNVITVHPKEDEEELHTTTNHGGTSG